MTFRSTFSLLLLSALPAGAQEPSLPPGFVDLSQAIPGIALEVRYAGAHNFVGVPIEGYGKPRVLLTHLAAVALGRAEEELEPFGLGLKVFDGYRPQRAVDHFVRWAKDLDDQKMKGEFYPNVEKGRLFELGYVAEKSGHTRGSTVDLTLIDRATGAELDMGSPYDLFDPISWPASPAVPSSARANRLLLREVMLRSGFKPYEQEWWHFTLAAEPFPATYFDVPLE